MLQTNKSSESLEAKLVESLDQFALEMSRKGIVFKPYTTLSLNHLSTLSGSQLEKLRQSFNGLRSFWNGVEHFPESSPETNSEEGSIHSELHTLQKALWQYKYFSKVDLKEYLQDGDVVEIYDSNHVQVYRNFEFFKYSSYSLLDIMTQEWFNLYERPESVTRELIQNVQRMYELGQPLPVGVPPHIMKEKYLDSNKAILLRTKWLIPLFSQDSEGPTALVHIVHASNLDELDASNVSLLGRSLASH